MKNNAVKIIGILFATTMLSSFLSACEEGNMGLPNVYHHREWGDNKGNPFNDDNWWNNNGGNGNQSSTPSSKSGSSASSNKSSSNPDGYTLDCLSYTYYEGKGECGVKCVLSALGSLEEIKVPATYTDDKGNVYTVKYDCDQGFNGLSKVKTVIFSDGFEKVAVGFGSSAMLEKVVLPASLKKIDCRMLVNCRAFKTIDFKGTKAQWEAVNKIESWNDMAPEFTVTCTDGNITVPVYVEEE